MDCAQMTEEMEATDETLMAQIAEGDEPAFSALVRRHQNMIYGTIAKMIGDRAEAEDLAQEVFIRAYKAANHYRPTAKFTTWLLTICRHCVFSYLRRRKHWFFFSNDEEDSREVIDTRVCTAQEEILQRELEDAVQKALAQLPEKQRMAIILRQYHQMDYEEIARVMDVSLASVKTLIFRGREELKKTLKLYLIGGV
jgi:RNA polymerase sigma-70 factor, ECF subfamily